MSSPKISIIVPCYNQAQYLNECLQSVLDQTYTFWECFIIDDGSPDNTEKIAKIWVEKDPRFQFFKKENGGVSSARNFGLEKSTGNYIQFLDGDDVLESDKLKYQVNIIEKNKKIDIIYGNSRYFFSNKKDNLFAVHPSRIIPSIDLQYDDKNQLEVLTISNFSTICATLYKAEIFKNVVFQNTVYEDYLLHLQISSLGYVFHFETHKNGKCLIRITEQSQMIKHIGDKVNNKIFLQEVKKIINKNKSEFVNIAHSPEKTKKKSSSTITNIGLLTKILLNFCPPILLKFFKKSQ